MLFANLKYLNQSDYQKLQKAILFLNETDLTTTPLGRSHEEGTNFYCQTLEYATEDISDVAFEIHEKRLDLHYIVTGQEEIDISSNTDYGKLGSYDEKRDLQLVEIPTAFNKIILQAGDFVLIGMHEPHRTNGFVNQTPSRVRKIVLKLGR